MKALLLEDRMRLSYVDLPVPELGPADVLVAVRACGICGSDVHGFDGSTGRRVPPLVMGHEASGVVAHVGARAGEWQEGDRVTFDSTLYCGECAFCLAGQSNLCERRRVLGAAFAGYRKDGAFAEYVAVPGRVLTRLPDEVSFEQAALVEPLSVALHAVARAEVRAADSVAVVGTGMIGLLVVQALRAAGVRRVIGIDLDPGRLELARRLGADDVLRADAGDFAAAVRGSTGGSGADVAIEVVGTTPAIGTALTSLRPGGRLVLIGNVAPTVEIPLQAVVTGELTLAGSCASSGEYATAVDLLASGAIDVGPLISAVAPLREGASWFARLHAAEPGLLKVILKP
jgi:L-iditol 2-dehydrogenase